jgi:hypothetical protein
MKTCKKPLRILIHFGKCWSYWPWLLPEFGLRSPPIGRSCAGS